MRIANNQSAHDVEDEELPAFLAELLETWQVPADRPSVEITETAVVRDPSRALGVLRELAHERRDQAVRSTIDLGHSLGSTWSAEAVEDQAALATLTTLGCDLAQGYFLSWPVPAEELPAWLAAFEQRWAA
jgi:EAL domain-containing protein (putative c-di-GMP-specific phosphodiesterase class I)